MSLPAVSVSQGFASQSKTLRTSAWNASCLGAYEDAHYQFRLGTFDPELWAGWRTGLTQAIERNGDVRYAWSQNGMRYSAPFRALVDSLVAAQ